MVCARVRAYENYKTPPRPSVPRDTIFDRVRRRLFSYAIYAVKYASCPRPRRSFVMRRLYNIKYIFLRNPILPAPRLRGVGGGGGGDDVGDEKQWRSGGLLLVFAQHVYRFFRGRQTRHTISRSVRPNRAKANDLVFTIPAHKSCSRPADDDSSRAFMPRGKSIRRPQYLNVCNNTHAHTFRASSADTFQSITR